MGWGGVGWVQSQHKDSALWMDVERLDLLWRGCLVRENISGLLQAICHCSYSLTIGMRHESYRMKLHNMEWNELKTVSLKTPTVTTCQFLCLAKGWQTRAEDLMFNLIIASSCVVVKLWCVQWLRLLLRVCHTASVRLMRSRIEVSLRQQAGPGGLARRTHHCLLFGE